MSNLEFFVYTIIIVIIILFIVWLFFGGEEYEYKGLDILAPPQAHSSDYCDVSSDEFETESESELDTQCSVVEELETNEKNEVFEESECAIESESKISTVIKFLPSHDIDYYRNFKLIDEKIIKLCKMEKKTALESRGEALCRNILEKSFGKPFPSARPDFLLNPETNKNLELDCFNEELGLALEYNGAQHYDFPNKFHKTLAEHEAQRRRDHMKKEVCEAAGIYLITVPYRIPHHKLPKFIEYYLPENVQHRRENGIEDVDEDAFWDENPNTFPKNGFL